MTITNSVAMQWDKLSILLENEMSKFEYTQGNNQPSYSTQLSIHNIKIHVRNAIKIAEQHNSDQKALSLLKEVLTLLGD